jgi:hypothetical protein
MNHSTQANTRRNDWLLIGGLLLVGAVFALILFVSRADGRQVVVRVDGAAVATFSLTEDREWLIDGVDGGTNSLVIQQGKVWLEEASCPDHLCVKQGTIQYAGESIICLPNKVVVEITGEDELALDGVTG